MEGLAEQARLDTQTPLGWMKSVDASISGLIWEMAALLDPRQKGSGQPIERFLMQHSTLNFSHAPSSPNA